MKRGLLISAITLTGLSLFAEGVPGGYGVKATPAVYTMESRADIVPVATRRRSRVVVRRRSKKKSAAIVAGSAATGAAIGALAHGGKGAAVGAAVGGTSGYVYDRTTHKKTKVVPQ